MAITIFGLIILLTFIKPSNSEIEAFQELDKSKKELLDVIAQTFKIPELVEWLSRKLKK